MYQQQNSWKWANGNSVERHPMDRLDNLTKLSQYARSYATSTIDKTIEVQLLLKEKEERV